MAVDKYDNVYFADSKNFRIRKIFSESGIIQTIAGTGDTDVSGTQFVSDTLDANHTKLCALQESYLTTSDDEIGTHLYLRTFCNLSQDSLDYILIDLAQLPIVFP